MKKWFGITVIVVLILALLVSGCTQNQISQPAVQPTEQQTTAMATMSSDTIKVASTSLGNILVDSQGKSLYYFALDIPSSGTSVCSGSCAAIWPVFSTDTIAVSPPLVASDFSSFVRTDGTKQTTYRGWPLYYFQADSTPGDVYGENVTHNWFVVKPDETVMIAERSSLGFFLVDKMGNTLYYFAKDTPGASSCTGACTDKWPPFDPGVISAPSALNPVDFRTITRADGTRQTTFVGRPLYYFSNDAKPGDTNGEGFNNLWYVANITGTVPAVPTPTPPPITPVPTQSIVSYGGY